MTAKVLDKEAEMILQSPTCLKLLVKHLQREILIFLAKPNIIKGKNLDQKF